MLIHGYVLFQDLYFNTLYIMVLYNFFLLPFTYIHIIMEHNNCKIISATTFIFAHFMPIFCIFSSFLKKSLQNKMYPNITCKLLLFFFLKTRASLNNCQMLQIQSVSVLILVVRLSCHIAILVTSILGPLLIVLSTEFYWFKHLQS